MYHSLDVLVGLTQFKDRIIKFQPVPFFFVGRHNVITAAFQFLKNPSSKIHHYFLCIHTRSNYNLYLDYYKFVYATIFFC
jgi:hypothetical protein